MIVYERTQDKDRMVYLVHGSCLLIEDLVSYTHLGHRAQRLVQHRGDNARMRVGDLWYEQSVAKVEREPLAALWALDGAVIDNNTSVVCCPGDAFRVTLAGTDTPAAAFMPAVPHVTLISFLGLQRLGRVTVRYRWVVPSRSLER